MIVLAALSRKDLPYNRGDGRCFLDRGGSSWDLLSSHGA